MIKKEDLLKRPNYLLTKYQNEIYRQLIEYKETNGISQSEIAKKLDVSDAYVSQVFNGEFNFTLKKIIEIGLMIGKIPTLNFVDINKYIADSDNNFSGTIIHLTNKKAVNNESPSNYKSIAA